MVEETLTEGMESEVASSQERGNGGLTAWESDREKLEAGGSVDGRASIEDLPSPDSDREAEPTESEPLENKLPCIDLSEAKPPKMVLPEVEKPKEPTPNLDLPEVDFAESKSFELELPDIDPSESSKTPSIDLPEVRLSAAQIPGLQIPEVFGGLVVEEFGGLEPKAKPEAMNVHVDALSARDALTMIHLLMPGGGGTVQEKTGKLAEFASALNQDAEDDNELLQKGRQLLLERADNDPDAAVDIVVDEILSPSYDPGEQPVALKVFAWNLLAAVFDNGPYESNERTAAECALGRLGLDEAVLAEMEELLLALKDLEGELAWLDEVEDSNYEVGSVKDEVAHRMDVLMAGARALVLL